MDIRIPIFKEKLGATRRTAEEVGMEGKQNKPRYSRSKKTKKDSAVGMWALFGGKAKTST